jgi:hypothetical protein
MNGYERYKDLEDDHVILSFKGSITSDLLSSILHIIENKLEDDPMVKRKVFNIMVETLQNLYFFVDDVNNKIAHQYQNDVSSGLFVIRLDGKSYEIITGNYVLNQNIDLIEKSITMVNTMTAQELRDHYKQLLLNNDDSDENDLGLGFIDIARKADHKIEFSFDQIDSNISFFNLLVKVDQL